MKNLFVSVLMTFSVTAFCSTVNNSFNVTNSNYLLKDTVPNTNTKQPQRSSQNTDTTRMWHNADSTNNWQGNKDTMMHKNDTKPPMSKPPKK